MGLLRLRMSREVLDCRATREGRVGDGDTCLVRSWESVDHNEQYLSINIHSDRYCGSLIMVL